MCDLSLRVQVAAPKLASAPDQAPAVPTTGMEQAPANAPGLLTGVDSAQNPVLALTAVAAEAAQHVAVAGAPALPLQSPAAAPEEPAAPKPSALALEGFLRSALLQPPQVECLMS